MTVLVAHFLVGGAKVHGHGAPRGERQLHMGEVYAANPAAIPDSLQYIALGHIHAPQSVPGSVIPAEYAGSLLQLDFGEAGETKRVVIVEVERYLPATVRAIQIHRGRRLLQIRDTWDGIINTPEAYESYLDLTVVSEGPESGLANRSREHFPYLVKVRAEYPREQTKRPVREGRSLSELYKDYYVRNEGVEPSDELAQRFEDLVDKVGGVVR